MNKTEILRKEINRRARGELRQFFDAAGVCRTVIGKTLLGAEIDAYRVGFGRRALLYIGCHHSLEAICENLLFAFLYELALDESVRSVGGKNKSFLLQKFTFYVIPALNIDGIAIVLGEGRDNVLSERQRKICGGDFAVWQANARGVDLNHNYDAGFFEYKAIEREAGIYSAPSKYSGEYPESEPESAAVANFLRIINPALVLSLHTQGGEVYYSPKNDRGRRLAERFAGAVGYRVATPEGSAKYGGLCDYSGTLGIPSLTAELGVGKNPLPISHAEPLYSRVRESLFCLPTML